MVKKHRRYDTNSIQQYKKYSLRATYTLSIEYVAKIWWNEMMWTSQSIIHEKSRQTVISPEV